MLALSNACPDDLGCELALAVAQFGLEGSFRGGSVMMMSSHSADSRKPVLECVSAVLVVDQTGVVLSWRASACTARRNSAGQRRTLLILGML